MTTVQINAAPKRLTMMQWKQLIGSRMMEAMIKNCAVVVDGDQEESIRVWDGEYTLQKWLRDNCTTHYFIQYSLYRDGREDDRWLERVYFLSASDMVHFKLAKHGTKIA